MTIVLVMALPDNEAARPAAVIFGHLLSCIAGLAALWTLGSNEIAMAAGVGLATLLMLAARAVHPRAGINAFLVPANALSASWVLNPILLGSILLVAFAALGGFRVRIAAPAWRPDGWIKRQSQIGRCAGG